MFNVNASTYFGENVYVSTWKSIIHPHPFPYPVLLEPLYFELTDLCNFQVIGNTDDLGAWDIDSAFPLGAGGYTSERPLWSGSAFLTAGQTISYKYVRQENCGQPWLYETGNRTLTVPAWGGSDLTTDDAWRGPVGTSGNC